MAKYDEVEIIRRAYVELRALDRDGQLRAIAWLSERLEADHQQAIQDREQAMRDRIAKGKSHED